jgi:hypothetical protein
MYICKGSHLLLDIPFSFAFLFQPTTNLYILIRLSALASTLKSRVLDFDALNALDLAVGMRKRWETVLEQLWTVAMRPSCSLVLVELPLPFGLVFGPSTTCNDLLRRTKHCNKLLNRVPLTKLCKPATLTCQMKRIIYKKTNVADSCTSFFFRSHLFVGRNHAGSFSCLVWNGLSVDMYMLFILPT